MVFYDSITVRSDGNPFRSHRTNLFLLIMDLLPTYFFIITNCKNSDDVV